MKYEDRCKKTKEENEAEWEEIRPLMKHVVDLVWSGMNKMLRQRYPKDELMNQLWLRYDWAEKRQSYPAHIVAMQMYQYLWRYMSGVKGGVSARGIANRKLSEGDEETMEQVFHNHYRAQPSDPSDAVADSELLAYLRNKLTDLERKVFDAYMIEHKSFGDIAKQQHCSERTVRRQIENIVTKMRHWMTEQGW